MPTLSVLGEAIEACAWIGDQRRNTQHQHMTPAFFRRWLRRSQRGEEALPLRGKGELSAAGSQPIHEPDQYEVYVNALIAQYKGPEVLQEVG